jgi:hypothetical protein
VAGGYDFSDEWMRCRRVKRRSLRLRAMHAPRSGAAIRCRAAIAAILKGLAKE